MFLLIYRSIYSSIIVVVFREICVARQVVVYMFFSTFQKMSYIIMCFQYVIKPHAKITSYISQTMRFFLKHCNLEQMIEQSKNIIRTFVLTS